MWQEAKVMSMADDMRREKARNLRYKRPMLANVSLNDIQYWLREAQDKCNEWAWVDENQREALMDALDGNDDEYSSYQMMFATLENDIEKFEDDLQNIECEECFDDMVCGFGGDGVNDMMGYDEFEGDYVPLESSWEKQIAIEEARERLTKKYTKKRVLELTGECMRIVLNYIAMDYRLAMLNAAVDIVKEFNGEILRKASDINKCYEELMQSPCDYERRDKFDRMAAMLPDETWLR